METLHLDFTLGSITTYGKKVLESGEIIPHDSYDYLVRLKKAVPDLDDIVLIYAEESLQCYLNGNLMASSVMLGVASEVAFYRLLEAFKKEWTNRRTCKGKGRKA